MKLMQNRTLDQNVTVSTDVTLSSLEFTEPWYDKKEKTWYCLAYVTRKKAWEQYRPTLQATRDKLFSFYELADKNTEPLNKMKLYVQSTEYEDEFYAAYNYVQIMRCQAKRYAHP